MPDPGQLYIRWSATGADDNRTDPGANVWWLSKSVGIFNPSDTTQSEGLAITGVAQKIRVNIDTLLTKDHVGVQAWVCAYGTAGQPYLPSALEHEGLLKELDDQIPPQPYTATAGPQLTIDIPWTPDSNDLTSLGYAETDDLHVCLLANCFATPTTGAPDGQKITAQPPPIDVPNNRHHAQHNIVLHGVASGAGGMSMSMFAGNPAPEGEDVFQLEVVEQRDERLLPELVELARNSSWAEFAADAKLRLPQEPANGVRLEMDAAGGQRFRAPLAAGKPQRMQLTAEFGSDEAGVVRAFEILQRRGREVVGGARLVTLGVPDDFFKERKARRKSVA
jgi:hypothetical protein